MKRLKVLAMIVAVVLLAAIAAGCGGSGSSGGASPAPSGGGASPAPSGGGASPAPSQDNKVYNVGFSVKDQTNPLFVDMVTAARETIDNYNKAAGYEKIKLNVQACTGETKVEEQLTTCETFLTQDVDAIICTPLNSDAFVDFVKRCNDEKVAFINLDTMVNPDMLKSIGANFDVFIGSDNIWLGENVTRAMVEDFPDGCKYFVLGGNPGAATHIGMDQGYNNIKATMSAGFIELKYELCNWQEPQALETTSNLLPTYPEVQAIIAFNDQMAQGAIAAIESFGKTPGTDIKVYGSNFVGNAPQFIVDGKQAYSQSRRPLYSGQLAAECAINFIDGKTPIHELIDTATRLIEFPGTVFRQGLFTLKDGKPYDMNGNFIYN